jgi:translation initiation factor 5
MSEVFLQVEGKGNGIKTVIANMTEIAKALERPPTCPLPDNHVDVGND